MKGKCLLELLCEEIPANALPETRKQLAQAITEKMAEASVSFDHLEVYSTARRLALWLSGLPHETPEKVEVVQGPPVRAAFASDGSPTHAAEGFARACGVKVEELEVVEGPKGKVVVAKKRVAGKPMPEFLAGVLTQVILSLRFPKTMRWGEGNHTFVRPVHRVVALWGENALEQVVALEFFDVHAGSRTLGHRVVHPGELELLGVQDLAEYLQRLRAAGVVLDPEERRSLLRQKAADLAAQVGCLVRPDAKLEDEHVELVEFPGIVRGELSSNWLSLPEEIIVTTLRHHQKCLVLVKNGAVAPYFLAVCDRPDDPEEHVRRGNEWVAGARLADAQFFFNQDCQSSLEAMAEKLHTVVFHVKLGTYGEKSERVGHLAERIAQALNRQDLVPSLQQAARLAKADLASLTVGEFPELQGVMGGLFAKRAGLPLEVCQALLQQYQPAGQEGQVPENAVGAILGVADRMDTLAALFSIGELPTGSKDPFGLRRQALGVVRICGEFPLSLRLTELVSLASEPFAGENQQTLVEFLRERERFFLEWRGLPAPVVDAVMNGSWGFVDEDHAKGQALTNLWRRSEFVQLATAFKRVRNMVSKEGEGLWQPQVLREAAERDLAVAVEAISKRLEALCQDQMWLDAFYLVGELASPLDRFFSEVLVLCENQQLRQARLGLLASIQRLFLRLADVSKLQGAN